MGKPAWEPLLPHLVGDLLANRHSARVCAAEQGVLVRRSLSHGDVEDALGKGHVVRVLGHEVRLAVQGDDAAAVAVCIGRTLRAHHLCHAVQSREYFSRS